MNIELLWNEFVSTHELRKDLPRLLATLRREKTELIVTQQGKPVAVIIDIEK